eukprot:6483567-Amphidinium_carterae.1
MSVTSASSRAILFGPHPELSSKHGGWDVLVQAVEWICPEACARALQLGKDRSARQCRARASSSSSSSSSV